MFDLASAGAREQSATVVARSRATLQTHRWRWGWLHRHFQICSLWDTAASYAACAPHSGGVRSSFTTLSMAVIRPLCRDQLLGRSTPTPLFPMLSLSCPRLSNFSDSCREASPRRAGPVLMHGARCCLRASALCHHRPSTPSFCDSSGRVLSLRFV